METCTVKYDEECMDYPKQASLHRNFLKHNSRQQATHRANLHYIEKNIMYLIRVLKEHYKVK